MRKLSFLAFVFLFFSCKKNNQREDYIKITGGAQGTTFSVVYEGNKNFEIELLNLLVKMDKELSLWDDSSLISKINRNEKLSTLGEYFVPVFERSKEVFKISDGNFDPTVRPVYTAWGFDKKKPDLQLPNQKTIDSLRNIVGFEKVSIKANQIIKENPGVQLDFDAIAQGYTVDLIANYLEDKGVKNYLVEIGGELRAKGLNQDSEIWKVGIEKPSEKRGELQLRLALNNGALATSGNYRKYVEIDGKKYGHTINPKTCSPALNSLLSVSVIAKDACTADAFATWFMVIGKEKAIEEAKKHGVELYLIYEEDGPKVYNSPGIKFLD